MKTNHSSITDAPWFDPELYPFKSHFFSTPEGSIHYVDEGKGDPILFVHGTPAWSFLYREQISAFRSTHRCIAPDHLGFGLSDKPPGGDYRPETQAQRLGALMEHLELDNITLVVHDFGGPIGLSAALMHPEKIKRVVLMNTWLWETVALPAAQKVNRILNSAMGKFLYLRLNISPKVLLKKAFSDASLLSKSVHRHYTGMFPGAGDRYGLLRTGQALVGSSDWYQEQWSQLDALAAKPFLILWGMKDPFLSPDFLEKWENRLGNAKTVRLECGHFVQEEAAHEMIKEMKMMLEQPVLA